jgi:RimJ/RimL family protein N-acetyltransferase
MALHIRSIQAADENLYRSILERTSEEDRYCRFLHVVNHFDPVEIRRFVEPAPDLIGFIAIEGDEALGAAHACFLADGSAELAIIVARDARHQGTARALVLRVIDEIAKRGCRRLIAYALAENYAMTSLALSLGMTADGIDANVTQWTLEIHEAQAA